MVQQEKNPKNMNKVKCAAFRIKLLNSTGFMPNHSFFGTGIRVVSSSCRRSVPDAMSFCRFIDDVWTPGSIMFKIILPTISLKSSELSAV